MTTARAVEKNVTLNGVRLRYLDWGTTGKTPLICLHGHTGQARIWDEFAEAMAPSYHVLALDQRGHGESDWAHDGYQRERFVGDVAAFVDLTGAKKVVLCGLSMGGWNSLLYAAQYPDRVERVVIVDIGPEASEASRKSFGTRPPSPTEFRSLDEAFEWARGSNPWASDERLRRDLQDRLRRHGDGRWRWRADPVLFATRLRDNEDPAMIARYWDALRAISCPILEVRGAGSVLLDEAVKGRMLAANKSLSWMDVPNAGHVVPVDKPQEFIQATRGFLGV